MTSLMRRLNPPQIVIISFLVAILLGAFLLSLPQSSSDNTSIGALDAFFTATSATCVTGLIVRDTGADFSRFGQLVILFLIQVGGLGIMTLSTFFAILLGRKLTLRDNVVVKSAIDHHSVEGLKFLIVYILGVTFGIEAIGAVCLYNRFGNVYQSIFHSISAFCNAGFSLNSSSFTQYRQDGYINVIMMALIILGGIGFIVLLDFNKICKWVFGALFFTRKDKIPRPFPKISLQTKLVLSVSAALIFLGAFVVFILERNSGLLGGTFKSNILASLFQSVSARTAGFNTVPIKEFTSPVLFFLIILMFIGASPGSTGGGIKTCTFGIVAAGLWSMIRNRPNIRMFKRTIPVLVFRKAAMVTALAFIWVAVFTTVLSFTESGNELMPNYFLRILFELSSAFGTVGLSTGITPILSNIGKVIIMLTMFVGRIGPMTLALAVSTKEIKAYYKYPEEKVMVG